MNIKAYLKWYFILPMSILLFLLAIYSGWYIMPAKKLDIVVLNKTVPASKVDKFNNTASDYRKHLGLFWFLTQQKYVSSDTGKLYNYENDYYGPHLDDKKTVTIASLERLSNTPDLLYIADAYGDERSDNDNAKGLSFSDMNVIGTALANGSTVIGESDIISVNTSDSAKAQIEELFGIRYGEWTGRYIYDMQDFTDIPEWALKLHETEYGRTWDYKGSGILLVSKKSEIIILEQKDFNSKNLMRVSITDQHKKQFGNLNVNFYNWFEIIEPEYGTDVIAEFAFNLNENGKEKLSKVSNKNIFAAVTRKHHEKAPAYYYAGDFNDYVARERYPKYLLSYSINKFFSYDRPGDITNFYWRFYLPLIKSTLKEIKNNKSNVMDPQENETSYVKIEGDSFFANVKGQWQLLTVKGFNINAVMPGSQPYEYSRDIAVYRKLIDEAFQMGGNCIGVYDLMPPEFYRALADHNVKNPENTMYFIQKIVPPSIISSLSYSQSASLEEMQKDAYHIIDAIHGKGKVPDVGLRKGASYINDVSSYLAAYIIDINTDEKTVEAINAGNPQYRYNGNYISCAASPAESVLAFICDSVIDYQLKNYKHLSPIGAAGNQSLIPSAPWSGSFKATFDPCRLEINDDMNGNFFVSYSLMSDDSVFLANAKSFIGYSDESGEFYYGGYIDTIKKLQSKYPILINGLGLSTNINAFEREDTIHGLTEKEQGNGIVRMLSAAEAKGYLGALISDLNDSWSGIDKYSQRFTIPVKDNPFWQNRLDLTQNMGILALSPKKPDTLGMSLKDFGRMREMQFSADQAYLYITVVLDREVDYDIEEMFIGLDTYQRNNGEYLFDPHYFANSLSGMEYIIKFESKTSAAVYVTPSYNREKKGFSSKESYNGKFDYIASLSYGSFESLENQFYQTGSTVNIRIPWGLINFTNPSKKMVVYDTRSAAEIDADPFQILTTTTDGILFSLLIADKKTSDTLYIFPENKQSGGYRTFAWHSFEKTEYNIKRKESFSILSKYFSSK